MKTNDKVINVGIIYNAFDPTDVKRAELVYRKNTMLKTYLQDLPTDCDWLIGLNGNPVDLVKDGKTKLKANDTVTLVVVPHGDGGVKGILRMVAMIAVVVGASLLFAPGGALAGSSLFGLSAATTATLGIATITAVGGMLINAVLPPTTPKSDLQEDSPSYGYDGAKNTSKQGIALPVIYGRYRVAGNYVDIYSQNVGDDQYLYGRTVLSDGRINNVTLPLLNDQPIENYTGVDWGFTHGDDNETVNPYFNRNLAQINKSIKMSSGVYVTHTTTSPVDQIQLNFQFSRGLVHIDKKKNTKQNRTATVSVEITEHGTNNWRPMGKDYLQQTNGDMGARTTPITSKLAVSVDPTIDTTSVQNYSYEIQYKKASDSTWTSFRTVTGSNADAIAYTPYANNWDDVNSNQVTYSYQAPGQSFEWAVPAGSYQIRVVGQGAMTSWGYSVSAGGQLTYSFTDNRAKVIRKTIESGTLNLAVYDIRVRKTSADGDDEYDLDEMYLTDVGEITTTGIALKNVATAYYRIKMSEQLSGVPNITWLADGVEVNQYDNNGKVTVKEWTDNCSWIVLDMLIGDERGSPQIFNIDFPMFVEWAQYCQDMGLKFNGIFDTTTSLWDACVAVLKVGHASFTRIGTKLSLTIDRPQAPVMLFGPGNIFKDSFKVSYLAMTGRANEFELSYFDRDDNNTQKTIRIVDPDANNRGDMPRAVTYQMPGIDNFDQAHKEAWYQLYNNRYIRRTITFDAPIESIGLGIGDVALIQHDMMDWGTSGRLVAAYNPTSIKLDKLVEMDEGVNYSLLVIHDKLLRASGTNSNYNPSTGIMTVSGVTDTSITLDNVKRLYQPSTGRDYEIVSLGFSGNTAYVGLTAPDVFTASTVQFYDTDVIEERDVVYAANQVDTLTVTSPFSQAPNPYVNYMFGVKTINKKPYRLKGINGTGFDTRTLTFIEYVDAIYGPPEHIVPYPPTTLPKGVKHVKELQYVYDNRSTDVNTIVSGVLSWNASGISNYGGADIYVGLNGANFVLNKTVLNVSECQLDFHFSDTALVKVVAFNTNLIRAPIGTAPYVSINIAAGPVSLDPPTGLTVDQVSYLALGIVEASWEAPDSVGNDPVKYRVQLSLPTGAWDEYATTTDTTLRVGDLEAGIHSLRVRTERAESFSTWASTTFNVVTTEDTIAPGATVGGVIGQNIHNSDGSLYVPGQGGSGGAPAPIDTTPPGVPTGLVLTSNLTDTGVDLIASWNAPTDADLAGYDLAVRVGSGTYINFNTTSTTYKISGQPRNTTFTAKVRAYDKSGNRSEYSAAVTYTTVKDTTPPAPVTGLGYSAALKTIFLQWNNPSDADLAYVQVNEAGVNDITQSYIVDTLNATPNTNGSYTRSGLQSGQTVYYWLTTVDTSGNKSAPVGITTQSGTVSNADVTPGLLLPKASISGLNDSGVEGQTSVYNGKVVTYKNGTWVYVITDANTITGKIVGDQIADAAVDALKLATNLRAPIIVAVDNINDGSVVPVVFGSLAYNLNDGKLYRSGAAGNATGWYEMNYSAANIKGQLGSDQIANIIASKVTGQLTSDQIQSLVASKLAGQLNGQTQILPGSITTNQIAANTITANNILAGSINADRLAANSITSYQIAANTITAYNIQAASITGDKIAANSITAQNILAGTITGDKIAANTISGNSIIAGTIQAAQLAANSITASKIAVVSDNLFGDSMVSDAAWWTMQPPANTRLSAGYQGVAGSWVKNADYNLAATVGSPAHWLLYSQYGNTRTDTNYELYTPGMTGVSSNTVYSFEFGYENQSNAIFHIDVQWYNTDGNIFAGNGVLAVGGGNGGQSSVQITSPSAPVIGYRMVFYIDHASTGTAGFSGYIRVGKNVVRRANAATMYVDGTIAGNKIIANTITANQIAANTITAYNIAANTITGDKIVAGTIQAAQIAAGAITTTKLGITGESLFPDGFIKDVPWWQTAQSQNVYNAWQFNDDKVNNPQRAGGPNAWAITDGTVGSNNTVSNYQIFAPSLGGISGGTVYELRLTGQNATNRPYLSAVIQWFDGNGAYITAQGDAITSGSLRTISMQCTAPVNAATYRLYIDLNGSTAPFTGFAVFGGISFRQAATGSLIVDGTITGSKIQAGSIYADLIQAGTITGDKFNTGTNLPGTITVGNTGVSIETVRSTASQAYNNAATAINSINVISSDGYLSKSEKPEMIRQWNTLTGTVDYVADQANNAGVDASGMINSRSNLANYLNSLSPSWADVNSDTPVDGNYLRGLINDLNNNINDVRRNISNKTYSYANDPANVVNNRSTTIDPGKILIAGNTTLANWRNGGDNTKIEGGNIAANTITANKVSIGVRGVNILDIAFDTDRNRTVSWSTGYVEWMDENNNRRVDYMRGGSGYLDPNNPLGIVFVWFDRAVSPNYFGDGSGNLFAGMPAGGAAELLGNSNNIILAAYRGGTNLTTDYGRTIIDGDLIKTGTVQADRLQVNQLSAITGEIGFLRSYNGQGGWVERDGNGTRVYGNSGNLLVRMGHW
jgi:predicted phage tail protein